MTQSIMRAAIFSLVVALGQTGLGQSVPATAAGNLPPAIVVGFVGGFVNGLVNEIVLHQVAPILCATFPILALLNDNQQ